MMSLCKLATDDYQKRGDSYPKSGIPVDIQVYGGNVIANFKNTTEAAAKKWMHAHLTNQGYTVMSIESSQDGDYDDDWVGVHARVEKPV